MASISIIDLLNTSDSLESIHISDTFFINQQYFTLDKLYEFEMNTLSSERKHQLFSADGHPQDAMIFRLDGEYYLTSIDTNDGYRDDRGEIYQVNFDSETLEQFLASNSFENHIPFPIEVNILDQNTRDENGIRFFIRGYSDNQENILLNLTTTDTDSYYPRGSIYFNSTVLKKATELIEKQHLESMLDGEVPSKNKIKI